MTRRIFIWGLTGVFVATTLVSTAIFSSDDLPWTFSPVVALVLGVLIETRAQGNVVGRLMIVFAVSTLLGGILLNGVSVLAVEGAYVAWGDAVGNAVNTAGVLLLPMILLRFPDGRPLSGRWRRAEWIVIGVMAVGASAALLNGGWGGDVDQALAPSPLRSLAPGLGEVVSTVFFVLLIVVMFIGAVSLFLRFRRSEGEQRHQLKWLLYAGVVVVAVLLVNPSPTSGWSVLVVGGAFSLIPIAVGVAVLRYRLYDIDLVINRTVLFLLLGGFITAVYALVVVGVGALVGRQLDLGLSILATAVVAFAFEPVRVVAQGWANRLAYGDRATPYEVLSDLTQRLATAESVQGLLDRIASRLADGTGAERTGVWVEEAGGFRRVGCFPAEDPTPTAMAWGDLPGQVIAVESEGDRLGALTIQKRRGEALTPNEQRLIDDLAGSASSVLRNLGLQAQLSARADELAASRRRLVDVQDLERRRMERELDEGAQQLVVSLKVKLNVAARLARSEEAEPLAELLDGMGKDALDAIKQIRSLARGLYPPLLEAEGLVAAVRSVGERAPVPVEVAAENIGRLPAELEATLFFSISEAITNAAKHAPGLPVTVRLTGSNGRISFEVEDQGPGFDPTSAGTGSGLRNMADRIDAVGGEFELISAPGRGTLIRGTVPLARLGPLESGAPVPVSG